MKKYNTNDYKGPVYVEYFLEDNYSTVHIVNNKCEILLMTTIFFGDLNEFINEVKNEFNVVDVNFINAFKFPDDAFMLPEFYSDENEI